jgi:copper resistance protein B
MKRLLLSLLAATSATPALAQHGGHAQPPAPSTPPAPPASTCTAEHAAMGHCTMPPVTPAPAPTATPPAAPATCTPEHAAMGHCTMAPATPPPAPTPPASTCTPEHAAMGHCTPAATRQADPHAGHDMAPAGGAGIPDGPPPPAAYSGPAHAQDLVYDPRAAARSRREMLREHGGMTASRFLLDQAEATFGEGGEGYAWDAQFWHGGDINKLWLKSEGEGTFGEALEQGEVQALYSRAIDPWFDLQAGIRQDFGTGSDRTHLVLGLQGLAPYWFEVEGALFLSTEGELTARFEAEYDLRLTQALILQPKAELDFSLQDMPDIGIGAGLSSASLGARLRYEFFPGSGPAVIAPYVGVEYEQAFGETADYREGEGEDAGGVRFLGGLRIWF